MRRTANRYALGRQAGFTLLEMLVALVVLGFLMIGLTQGVRAGLALWDAQTRRVGETAELDATARTLRRLLSGIAPAPSAGFASVAASNPELKGSTESLAFVGDPSCAKGGSYCVGPHTATNCPMRPPHNRSKPS